MGRVAFSIDRKTGIKTIVGEKAADIGGFRDLVVMATLYYGKLGASIIQIVIDIASEVLFQIGIPAFCLSVCLGMDGGGKITLYLERLVQF